MSSFHVKPKHDVSIFSPKTILCRRISRQTQIWKMIFHDLPELVREGSGILFDIFLLDRLTYDLEELNVALGILTRVHHNTYK